MSNHNLALIPLPKEGLERYAGTSTYKYPAIYKDTHDYTLDNIPTEKLSVGDVIVFSNATYEILQLGNSWRVRRISTNVDFERQMTDSVIMVPPQHGWCGVFRPRSVVSALPVAATAVTPDPARLWNGSCVRCGKGTYEGAWELQHEGGPCQASLGVVRR